MIKDLEKIALVRGLIGKPWKASAEGPEAFDCWGLARYARFRLFGDELPDINRPDAAIPLPQLRDLFKQYCEEKPDGWVSRGSQPSNGAIVIMGHPQHESHAGIYLQLKGNPGAVLHCQRDYGVLFEDLATLHLRGFARFHFFNKGD